jgi:hypothetical protein
MNRGFLAPSLLLCAIFCAVSAQSSEPRHLLLIAGPPSHPYAAHEHLAGFRFAAEWLERYATGISVTVSEGWPKDATIVARANAIVINSDGAGGNVAAAHAAELDEASARGAGIGLLHWTLDIPGEAARRQALGWIGGYYETGWSVNPMWVAAITSIPAHPVTRGVRPFTINDEWYFHMRFREAMQGVTPLLLAAPPDAVRERPDGPHSGNPTVRADKGASEILAWAGERTNGGRGFGFTGLHIHWNWAHPDYRKFLLNALVWLAGAEVPPQGVVSPAPTLDRLMQDIPKPVPAKWQRSEIDRLLTELTQGSPRAD